MRLLVLIILLKYFSLELRCLGMYKYRPLQSLSALSALLLAIDDHLRPLGDLLNALLRLLDLPAPEVANADVQHVVANFQVHVLSIVRLEGLDFGAELYRFIEVVDSHEHLRLGLEAEAELLAHELVQHDLVSIVLV